MQTLHTARDIRAWRDQRAGTVGLVPTMGNLHAGHRALLEAATARCERVVASVFVNPLQFGPDEDLDSYPRTPESDREMLETVGVDAVFAPSVTQMYPHGGKSPTRIRVHGLSNMLCGHQRPGHFEGVATVVAKLFNLVCPDAAFFGEKDYQQLAIIQRMVTDLCMGVEVVGVPTVREPDGLAMSSRNQYLDAAGRRDAPALAAALRACTDQLRAGERDYATLECQGWQTLRDNGFEPDYFEIRDADLGTPGAATQAFRVLAAGTLGRARLIDNMGLAVAGESK